MKATLKFEFDTFSADIEEVGDLSDPSVQAGVQEALAFLISLDESFKQTDASKKAATAPWSARGSGSKHAPVKSSPQRATKGEEEASDQGEWIEVSQIVAMSVNGKMQYKAQGGRFAKYGLPIYLDSVKMPDEVRKFLLSLPRGVHDVSDQMLHAYVEAAADGKFRIFELG